MKTDLSIIIVNYKSWDKLQLCLESILNQSQINLQIIIVDNFSNDNRLKDFKNRFKQINWIWSDWIMCSCLSVVFLLPLERQKDGRLYADS